MKHLLDRLAPYIGPHRHFDIVLSKYGPVYIYPVDRDETMHEAEVLSGPGRIIESVAFQMICDQMESWAADRIYPTAEELQAVRSRIQAMVSGLDHETEYLDALERYIAGWPIIDQPG